MIQVTFVCLGNICRSPMAEAVFQQLVNREGLQTHFKIDSAGTSGYHVGEPAHEGTRKVLLKQGIHYKGKARQVSWDDLRSETSYLIALDRDNELNLRHRFGDDPRILRLLSFSPRFAHLEDVPDPYYTGEFDLVYELVEDSCQKLLRHLYP